jgi:3-dehydroquinate synthase
MTSIHVAHAGADYDVIVGDLADARPLLERLAKGRRLPLISDERVFGLYGRVLADVASPDPVLVPEGEAAKDWRTLAHITDRLAAMDAKRGTPIIALGGGSVGDVAGLAASLFKRGCPIVHVPTTLLSQADSAIGGKTAIDASGQKNLAGSFHHPLLVLADPTLLDTLDARQLRSGLAEVVKYGLIDDPAFFDWCETNTPQLLAGDREARRAVIEHCVRAKARFVTADPDDTNGTRALLNFGHTFAHAIEGSAGNSILHGEAVAIGMALAFDFSCELGLCPAADASRVRAQLQAANLPTTISDARLVVSGEGLMNAMLADKKADADGPTLVLTQGIGRVFVAKGVDPDRLSDFLGRRA